MRDGEALPCETKSGKSKKVDKLLHFKEIKGKTLYFEEKDDIITLTFKNFRITFEQFFYFV